MILHILIFLASCFFLAVSGSYLVGGLMRIAKFLGWREFVVAFFVMAFACSLPNLFVGINSVLAGIPQLSFGDIVGGNVINLTLVVGLAVLFGRTAIPTESRMVQKSAMFSTIAAILPLLLIFDGQLSRLDGVILMISFFIYALWLFSKEDRFKKEYDGEKEKISLFSFLKNLLMIVVSFVLLLIASRGIVISAEYFSAYFSLSLALIGILVVGLGDTLPEIYFSIISARKRETWMILGDLIGSVIYTSTLVLGLVAFLSPIKIIDFSPFLIARLFLIISAIFFLLAIRTGKKITRFEGAMFLLLYITFVIMLLTI